MNFKSNLVLVWQSIDKEIAILKNSLNGMVGFEERQYSQKSECTEFINLTELHSVQSTEQKYTSKRRRKLATS